MSINVGQIVASVWDRVMVRYAPPDFLAAWVRAERRGIIRRGEASRPVFGLLWDIEVTEAELRMKLFRGL